MSAGVLLQIVALLGLIRAFWIWHVFRSQLASTTLTQAANWAGIAVSSVFIATGASAIDLPPVIQDQFWYWAAVLLVCPFISVLGSRRPTEKVWTGFIVLPLIAVLGWPALTALFGGSTPAPICVSTPVFLGFALVLVMGLGNYAGTRFGRSSLLAGAAVCLTVMPFHTSGGFTPTSSQTVRSAAALLTALSLFHARRQAGRKTMDEVPCDRIWFDFRDTFGIVWSIRIQERINQTAESEQWPCRLTPLGFEWDSGISAHERYEGEQRVEATLRWLLRRFVDPCWIDARFRDSADQGAQIHEVT